MVQIDRVIRLEIDAELFSEEISADYTEWWFDYCDLKDNKVIFNEIKKYYSAELRALKEGEADFISVYADIF